MSAVKCMWASGLLQALILVSRVASCHRPKRWPVGAATLELGNAGSISIEQLASYPLLLLDGYAIRRLFDAACRLANVEPQVLLQSRAPHTLLALAEAGQGVAVIPSLQRTDRYKVRIARITHRRKPLQERVAIQWDRRRPLPPYAITFCESLAKYMHSVLPITQPTRVRKTVGRAPPQQRYRKHA